MTCALCGFKCSPITALVTNHFRDFHHFTQAQLDNLRWTTGWRGCDHNISVSVQQWISGMYAYYLPSSEAS